MAKTNRDEGSLVMHKLLGEHVLENVKICKVCGVTEGQEIIEPYQKVKVSTKNINELMLTIMHLAERVRSLEVVNRDREAQKKIDNIPYHKIDKTPLLYRPDRGDKYLSKNFLYGKVNKKHIGGITDYAEKAKEE